MRFSHSSLFTQKERGFETVSRESLGKKGISGFLSSDFPWFSHSSLFTQKKEGLRRYRGRVSAKRLLGGFGSWPPPPVAQIISSFAPADIFNNFSLFLC